MNQFEGFTQPKENWSKLPHELIARLPDFTSQGEIMVVLYILRHTWGFQEFDEGKKITLDEFEFGRKRRDGTRMDSGVGMSRNAIMLGIAKAVEHGFIEVKEDNSDLARCKRWYKLCMKQGLRNETPGVAKRNPRGCETEPRTEKETIERNHNNKPKNVVVKASPSLTPEQASTYQKQYQDLKTKITNDDQQASHLVLTGKGISEKTASRLAQETSLARILEVCAVADVKESITDKPGWIVSALKKGWEVQIPTPETKLYAGVREL